MKNLADIKRRFKDNVVLTCYQHDFKKDFKFLNVPRKIAKLQSNAIMLEGGSWLYFKKAADWIIIDDNTFKIKFDENMFIHYKIKEFA
jgi:hypothetical protein